MSWTTEGDRNVYRAACPVNAFAPLLHEQIEALSLNIPYSIEWPTLAEKNRDEDVQFPGEDVIRVKFDGLVDHASRVAVEAVVANHDGTIAMHEDEAKRQRAAEILAQNEATIEAARSKRLSGQPLTTSELAAVADLFMFQGAF